MIPGIILQAANAVEGEASEISLSILDLAKLIIKSTNTVAGYTFGKKYKYEPYVRIPDISLITKICGWKPKLTLEEGIKKTIEWFIAGGMEKYKDKRKNIA